MVLDIIFAALLAIAFIVGLKQGLVKSIWKIAAWVITITAVYAALTPAASYLHETKAAEKIYDSVYNSIASYARDSEGGKTLSDITKLPPWLVSAVDNGEVRASVNDGITAAAENAARTVTDAAVKAAAAVGLFIIVRILLAVLFLVISAMTELPVIHGANKILGGVFSALNMLLCVYLALALVSLFANPSLYEGINNTRIVSILFENNILMRLFVK